MTATDTPASQSPGNIEFLRRLTLFSGLPQADLERLCGMSETIAVSPGEFLMKEGEVGDALYIIKDGEFEVTKRSGQQEVFLAMRGAGEVLGEMSLLDKSPRSASVRAVQDSHVLQISQDSFQRLLSESATAALEILHTSTKRLRNTQSMLQQSEKMAALGTLTAGLMHELNNPAAATRRSADLLGDALTQWQMRATALTALGLDHIKLQVVNSLRMEIVRRARAQIELDPLTRGDREYDLQVWLEDHQVDNAWELAPTLVSFGWDAKSVSDLCVGLAPNEAIVILQWLGAGCNVYALLAEVSNSAERISEIVKSVKEYSYKDQAPVQEVDIHKSLDNTLVMLKHKLKAGDGITVKKELAPDLPCIEAYGSELNQVWTNIIDNAIDAMQGRGELTLRTYTSDEKVVVEIADNGPGMPPEVKERIFEPFYTTKEPGKGTGLGLHITYNIVQKHHGQIEVRSSPGETCFQITLPLQLRRSS
ncbi:MAG: cyclic nucleotide-binding domain-containing protein [Chloroflexi bacterium]|nr:cyclic nucleotide-binding domain-containing protein [Chloroflexota bacterium]